jgi:small subunit ribosomal protein S8
MSMQDLLSDFVARINNAVMADKPVIVVLKNRLVLNVTKKLTTLGYINSYEDMGNTLEVNVNIKKITKLTRVSKPGLRKYISYKSIPRIIGGKGYNIISSSKGVLTHVEMLNEKVGGEILFQIF